MLALKLVFEFLIAMMFALWWALATYTIQTRKTLVKAFPNFWKVFFYTSKYVMPIILLAYVHWHSVQLGYNDIAQSLFITVITLFMAYLIVYYFDKEEEKAIQEKSNADK